MNASPNTSAQARTVVSRDPDIHGGELVFAGTRVPVDMLIDYLEGGHSVEDFLEGFPSVERWQVEAFLSSSAIRAGDRPASRG